MLQKLWQANNLQAVFVDDVAYAENFMLHDKEFQILYTIVANSFTDLWKCEFLLRDGFTNETADFIAI